MKPSEKIGLKARQYAEEDYKKDNRFASNEMLEDAVMLRLMSDPTPYLIRAILDYLDENHDQTQS